MFRAGNGLNPPTIGDPSSGVISSNAAPARKVRVSAAARVGARQRRKTRMRMFCREDWGRAACPQAAALTSAIALRRRVRDNAPYLMLLAPFFRALLLLTLAPIPLLAADQPKKGAAKKAAASAALKFRVQQLHLDNNEGCAVADFN